MIFLTSFLFLCHVHFENYSPLSLRQRSSLPLSCALNTLLLNATCLHLPGLVEHMVFSVALKPVSPLCFCVYTSLQCTTGYRYVSYLLSFLVSSTIQMLSIPQIGFVSFGYRNIVIINCFKKRYLFTFPSPRVSNTELLLLIILFNSYYTV